MIGSCERLHAMLRDLGIDATVGEGDGTLLVYHWARSVSASPLMARLNRPSDRANNHEQAT